MSLNITAEAQKQRASRNIRADCNLDTLLFAVLMGAEVHFYKSKMSSCAKKVYIGDSIIVDNKVKNYDAILRDGLLFECALRRLWAQNRTSSFGEVIVDSDVVRKLKEDALVQRQCEERLPILHSDVQTNPNLVLWGDEYTPVMSLENKSNCLRKRKTKNKEAAFSNAISSFIIEHGMSLSCQVMSRKLTTRTLHFFVWKRYVLPNGDIVTSEKISQLTELLRHAIDNQHPLNRVSVINRAVLKDIGITDELLNAYGLGYFAEAYDDCVSSSVITCPSAFQPCYDDTYTVITDSEWCESVSVSQSH